LLVKLMTRIVTGRSGMVAELAARFRPATVIVDVQPLVAPWQAGPTDVAQGMTDFARAVAGAVPATLRTLIFASNARLPRPASADVGSPAAGLVVLFVSPAHKPWRTHYLADLPRPMVVIGDQVLTDGMLACRLRAPFIQLASRDRSPWWPRLQTAVGRPVARVTFRTEDLRAAARNAGQAAP
jgi:hypothetical protein